MAASVDPAHAASLAEMTRIEAAALARGSVVDILGATAQARIFSFFLSCSPPTDRICLTYSVVVVIASFPTPQMPISELQKYYRKLSMRVHPHRGGSFDKVKATGAMRVVARSWEQARRAAEFDAYERAGGKWTSTPYDPHFLVPGILFYSPEDTDDETELLRAQEAAEEEEARVAASIIISSDEEDEGGAAAGGGGGSDDDGGGDEELAALLIQAPFHPSPEVAEVAEASYPDFDGETYSSEHRAYIVAKKLFLRKDVQRRSKAKGKLLAKSRLSADKLASLSWLPLTSVGSRDPEIGMTFSARWECEQFARSRAARKGVQGGVTISMDYEILRAGCKICASFIMVFNYQPKSGEWALRKFGEHGPGCFGAPTPADGATPGEATRPCKSAFTAGQVARLVVSSVLADANMSTAAVFSASSSCFLRAPSPDFFKSVKRAVQRTMATDRQVDMAALTGYADALRALGHKAPPPNCSTLRLPRVEHP